MRIRCRLGIHKWETYHEVWTKDDEYVVYVWNNCQVKGCRYELPILMDVEVRKRPAIGILP